MGSRLPSRWHRDGFKLIESAQTRWRMVNTPHLVALVRAGVPFTNGKQVERSDQSNTEPNAAEHAYPQVLTIPPLQTWDRQRLIEYRRAAGLRDRLTYAHQGRTDELLLSIPDAIAWSWARGGEWRTRVKPVVRYVRVRA